MRIEAVIALLLATPACTGGGTGASGRAVQQVVDGDTFDLEGGERIRMLGIDTPERGTNAECWGDEAFNYLSSKIAGRTVELEYDVVREDDFGRTLAYVRVGDELVNATMLSEGQACLLIIPPNGAEYETYFASLEDEARITGRGLWAACGGCDTPGFGP